MSTTTNQGVMKFAYSQMKLWSMLIIVAALTACGESKTTRGDADPNEASRGDATLFQGNAAFLEALFANCSCERQVPLAPHAGSPINCSESLHGLHLFCESYKAHANFSYLPVSITDIAAIENVVEHLLDEGSGHGIVFHYGYDAQSHKLVYTLSRGILDANGEFTFEPFSGSDPVSGTGERYMKLESGGTAAYTSIDRGELDALNELYLDNMERLQGGVFEKIDTEHPQMIYYSAQQLKDFFDTYGPHSANTLYIAHGAMQPKHVAEPFHTPCLFFGDGSAFYELDNPMRSGTDRYIKKGLDLGQLCPPMCDLVILGRGASSGGDE